MGGKSDAIGFWRQSGLLNHGPRGKRARLRIDLDTEGASTHGKEASMGYDREQAAEEFTRWSESYDHSILQWLLFGPSHRALIRRIETVTGQRPFRLLDVGCGTGLFASRMREALPHGSIWGVDLTSEMLRKGERRWRHHAGHVHPIQGD